MRQRGFTLIELLVAMVIVAILAGLAYPWYQSAIQQSRRSDAKIALHQVAQYLERYNTQNPAGGYQGFTLPTNYPYGTSSPDGYYTLSLTPPPDLTTYTIIATRNPGSQANDPCGDYTLNYQGNQSTVNGTLPAGQCWSM